MKLKVNEFEVTITAKRETAWNNSQTRTRKETAEETKIFLCRLCNALYEAVNYCEKVGLEYTAKERRDAALDIYGALDKVGYFDKFKEKTA